MKRIGIRSKPEHNSYPKGTLSAVIKNPQPVKIFFVTESICITDNCPNCIRLYGSVHETIHGGGDFVKNPTSWEINPCMETLQKFDFVAEAQKHLEIKDK